MVPIPNTKTPLISKFWWIENHKRNQNNSGVALFLPRKLLANHSIFGFRLYLKNARHGHADAVDDDDDDDDEEELK